MHPSQFSPLFPPLCLQDPAHGDASHAPTLSATTPRPPSAVAPPPTAAPRSQPPASEPLSSGAAGGGMGRAGKPGLRTITLPEVSLVGKVSGKHL